MTNCTKCKNFGVKGYIESGTIPYCFKKKEEVLNTKKRNCKYFDYKYVGGRLFRKGSRRRNHRRRSGGGI